MPPRRSCLSRQPTPLLVGAGLWEVELAEPITDADRVVLAPRGRLLRHMNAWHELMMRRYARACAWRVRDGGIERLHALGLNAPADTLAECTGLDSLAATATTLVDAVPEEVAIVVGYVADAATFSIGSMALVKAVPYVAAHAAGYTAGYVGRPGVREALPRRAGVAVEVAGRALGVAHHLNGEFSSSGPWIAHRRAGTLGC